MTDSQDEQDLAERLDQDELDPVDYPPDRSEGVGELLSEDVTAADAYAPDSIAERDRRLQPELRGTRDPGAAAGPGELQEDGEPAEPDPDVIDGVTLTGSPGGDRDPADTLPAEEAALHVVDEP